MNLVTESKEYKRKWREKAKSDFDNTLKSRLSSWGDNLTSSHRCLGMNALFEKGFILKSPIDFAVESKSYEDKMVIHSNCDFVNFGFFNKEIFGNYNCPKNCNKNLLKISNYLNLDCPKDVIFLILPIFYSDDNRFQVAAGILDPVLSREINIILFWFCENSYELIRKGTPLAQIIPICRDKIYDSWEVSDKFDMSVFLKDKEVKKYIQKSTLCPYYSEYKKISNDIFETK